MEPSPTQAVLLVGGRAERMRPYSDAMPKALMPADGLSLIARQLAYLERNNITDVVLSSGYEHRQISEYVGGGGAYGLAVRHAVDPHPLGTAGALRYAHRALRDPDEPFLVVNGSVITDMPLDGLFDRHWAQRATATMALVRYASERPVVLEEADGRIKALPQISLLPYWVDAGLAVIAPYAVKMLPEVGEITEFFEMIAAEGLLAAYHAPDGVFWRELSTVGDLYSYPVAQEV